MKFALHLGSEISIENFSLSLLITSVKVVFDTEALPGFLKAFVSVVEMMALKAKLPCPKCQSEKQHVHGISSKKLRTSIGEVSLVLTRVKCQNCGKTFIPMNRYFDLDQHSRKSREFEKLSLETITEQSFRRSEKHLTNTIGYRTPFTTLHRWFMKTTSTVMDVKRRVDSLIADGTGFKKKYDEFGSNRGEMKVMIGLSSKGEVIPFGAWSRASWKDIGRFVKRENHPSEKIKFKPIAETLISDGEEELINKLQKLAKSHQRCLFHMTYELSPLLQYRDYASKEEAIKLSQELGSLIYIDLPESDVDPLKNIEHKLQIEIKYKKMKEQIEEFIKQLKYFGYKKAMTFVENSKHKLFTYIENWLKTGISNPKVTSIVERIMREIKRRIKKIGFAWSEKGAEKMTRLVLLQLSSTKHFWDDYWKNKMGTDSKIKIQFLGVTTSN